MLLFIFQKMPVEVSLIMSRSLGSLNLIKSCTMQVKKTYLLTVLRIYASLLWWVTTAQSCAMDKLELVRLSQWMAQPQTSNTEVSFQGLSIKCFRRSDLTMIMTTLWRSVTWKSITSRCTICFLMSQEIQPMAAAYLFRMMLRERFMSKGFRCIRSPTKKRHSTSCSREKLRRPLPSLRWTRTQAELIASTQFMCSANLVCSRLRKSSTQSFILLISLVTREQRSLRLLQEWKRLTTSTSLSLSSSK